MKFKKKSQKPPQGKPLTRAVEPPRPMVKLKEEWTEPGDMWPRVYVGAPHSMSKWLKYLEARGLSGAQRKLLKEGLAVPARFGEGIRMLQIVAAESESGFFRHGEKGLEPMTEEELKNGNPTGRV